MHSKRIIAAIAGAALLVGAVVSGCNRNIDRDAIAARKARRQVKTTPTVNSDLAQASLARPAEVLAATVKRPTRPTQAMRRAHSRAEEAMYQNYLSPQAAAELARYEPLPEPVPLGDLYNPNPYNSGVVHGSPELTMARAAFAPMPQAAAMIRLPGDFIVPPIAPELFAAPIPELEPVRYRQPAAPAPVPQLQVPRLPALPHHAQAQQPQAQQQTRQQPAWQRQNVISSATPAPASSARDALRALEPIGQPPPAPAQRVPAPLAWMQDWVPSPATAMSE